MSNAEAQRERGRQMGLRNVGRVSTSKKRPYEILYNKLVSTATKRTYSVELTYEQYISFAEDVCHYCDAELRWVKHNNHKQGSISHNLDRKDNALGYSYENCVACCPRCNWGKGDRFSYQEWKVMTAALKVFKCSQNT